MKRYVRNIAVNEIGFEGQEKLCNSNVLVVGAGGLGSQLLFHLASFGFKSITICDGDSVSLSNLQRQIVYCESDVGKNKAITASKRLSLYNSEIEIKALDFFIDDFSIFDNFENFDLIFDCTDNYKSRLKISNYFNDTPIVFASVVELQGWVFTQETDSNISFQDIFQEHSSDINCDSNGVISPSVGFVSSVQAMEGIKVLLNHERDKNTLLEINCYSFDILKMNFGGQ